MDLLLGLERSYKWKGQSSLYHREDTFYHGHSSLLIVMTVTCLKCLFYGSSICCFNWKLLWVVTTSLSLTFFCSTRVHAHLQYSLLWFTISSFFKEFTFLYWRMMVTWMWVWLLEFHFFTTLLLWRETFYILCKYIILHKHIHLCNLHICNLILVFMLIYRRMSYISVPNCLLI